MRAEELKRRIKVVGETQKIVTAMQTIASSKMRRETQMLDDSTTYLNAIFGVVKALMSDNTSQSDFFKTTKQDKIAYLVVSSDSGLCGDYNHLILNAVSNDITEKNIKTMFPIGKLGREYYSGSSFSIDDSFISMASKPNEENALIIAKEITKRFLSGEFDCVQIAYTDSLILGDQKIKFEDVLPIPFEKNESPAELLYGFNNIETLIEQYLVAKVYQALCSGALAMNYKKLVTMRQASSNSEEMLEALQKKYNHQRQEKITSELLDTAISMQGKKL